MKPRKRRRMKKERLSNEQINKYLRVALQPPDIDLIRQHFAACAGLTAFCDLSEVDRKWVLINVEDNPPWQVQWQAFEKILGREVSPEW
jgi:hypothetical protein